MGTTLQRLGKAYVHLFIAIKTAPNRPPKVNRPNHYKNDQVIVVNNGLQSL